MGLPFVALNAKEAEVHRAAKGGAPPMRALGAFQPIAEFCVKMAGARVFAAGIQPDAGGAED